MLISQVLNHDHHHGLSWYYFLEKVGSGKTAASERSNNNVIQMKDSINYFINNLVTEFATKKEGIARYPGGSNHGFCFCKLSKLSVVKAEGTREDKEIWAMCR